MQYRELLAQADNLTEMIDVIEATMPEHGEPLSILQHEVADRQLKVIAETAAIRAAATAVGSFRWSSCLFTAEPPQEGLQ